jgi:hypothetical protein
MFLILSRLSIFDEIDYKKISTQRHKEHKEELATEHTERKKRTRNHRFAQINADLNRIGRIKNKSQCFEF